MPLIRTYGGKAAAKAGNYLLKQVKKLNILKNGVKNINFILKEML